MTKLAVLLFLVAGASLSHAVELPQCVSSAATEFGMPEKVFKAMAMMSEDKPALKVKIAGGEFGPMKLAGVAIDQAAKHIGTDASTIKSEACQNYRAAAWWLAVPAGGKGEPDIWKAVNRYFYGKRMMERYPMTEEVKRIYATL